MSKNDNTRISLPTPSKKGSLVWSHYSKDKPLQGQLVAQPQKNRPNKKGNNKEGRNI